MIATRASCRSVVLAGGLTLLTPGIARADSPLAYLVKDIRPGTASSDPGQLSLSSRPAVLNGTLMLFAAEDASHGIELWVTDATSGGTRLLKDIRPGSDWSRPNALIAVNGLVYFTADDGTSGRELWKSDGTPEGTARVADINPGAAGSILGFNPFADLNGTLFFAADDGVHGVELWKSDGTVTGTVLVKDIDPGSSSGPLFNIYGGSWASVNGELFFPARTSSTGRELWKTDGTAAGTVQVMDFIPGSASSDPHNLTNFNGLLIFNANGKLWRSNGTAPGTVELRALSVREIHVVGNTAFLVASEGTLTPALWKTDGTAAGTVFVKEFVSGTDADFRLAVRNQQLIIVAWSPATGGEIWTSDGTTGGTLFVRTIRSNALSSFLGRPLTVNGTVYFTIQASAFGAELWKTDGTVSGTMLVDDLQPGTASSGPSILGAVGGRLLFAATFNAIGRELYATSRSTSDFDGDGRADIVVYRPGSGQWWINRSTSHFTSSLMVPWGVQAAGDVPVPADFDGDGKVDPAVFRPQAGGTAWWFVRRSVSNYADFLSVPWGVAGDMPVPGYYDGDRLADPAVYRPSTGQWFIRRSSTGYSDSRIIQWGVAGDIPVPADYDGDRRTDVALYRPSTGQWFVYIASEDGSVVTTYSVQWGDPSQGDVPVPGDYTGDRAADHGVYRPGTGYWLVRRPGTQMLAIQWGLQLLGDLPMPADYDGDGLVDPAIYRPGSGQWLLLRSQAGSGYEAFTIVQWGNQAAGDVPIRER